VADSAKAPADSPPLQPGFLPNARFDFISGFLVFLIAMPLCLAIARASGYPPIAGIWTAVIGGVIASVVSNSQLTIKGPAAGLIVIVFGAVSELGTEFGAGMTDAERAMTGYKMALGIGVVAGVIQILFGVLRAGRLADFFPLTPVHGLLASIGLIIIAKQAYEVIGATPEKGAGPLQLYAGLPHAFVSMNPEIAIIGAASLVILFGLPLLKIKLLKKFPAQLFVLVVAVALGVYFDLEHRHAYLFPDSFFDLNHEAEFEVGPRFLVDMPEVLENPKEAFFVPDFRGVATATGIKYIILFCLIGSLESLLSAKAIELVDPWRRKTNHDRDLLAIGLGNTVSSLIGGLPMISEIVRSKANIDNGARTRGANFFHGMFLLAFVLLFPNLIHRIPLAALGAMLVYTGFRLASPHEFVRTYRIGSEQFVIFIGTILATLGTDLLIGIATGIGIKVGFHLWHGCPLSALIRSDVQVVPEGDTRVVLVVRKAAVFSNWLGLRAKILAEAEGREEVIIDLSNTKFVDHSVMEKLHQTADDFKDNKKLLTVIGLESHTPLANHPLAARRNLIQQPAAQA
jgi:MFS superfamily sulfate permease-like transporter